MGNTNNTIRTKIQDLITTRDISRNHLANTAGISYGALTRKICGQVPFTVPDVERIATALDVPIRELFEDAA